MRLTDEALFQCPYLHMEDVGTMDVQPDEVDALRTYLLKGGFVWVDDFWGSYAWDAWVGQHLGVLPPVGIPDSGSPLEHPMLQAQFRSRSSRRFRRSSRGAAIRTRRRSGAATAPRRTSAPSSDRHGNVMVLMTHNTDISDAWEREGEDPRYFYQFSPKGYAVGINVMMYAMTH